MTDTSPASETVQHDDRYLARFLPLFVKLLAASLLFVGVAAAEEDSQMFLCKVGMFKSSLNLLIKGLVVGFSPIAVISILGDRVISALPIGKKRKKKFKKWRGEALISTGIIYIILPVAVAYAKNSGFPLASCINFVPW